MLGRIILQLLLQAVVRVHCRIGEEVTHVASELPVLHPREVKENRE